MGRRIKYILIIFVIILFAALILGRCGNALLEELIVDVERAQNTVLTINSDGNGTVSPSGEITVITGESVDILAIPNTGYVFLSWTGSGINFGNRYSAATTVSLTGKTATITANFADVLDVKDLTINSAPNGTTNPSGLITALPGNPVDISATPAYSYEFSNWTIIGGSPPPVFGNINSASTTVTITENSIIQANFSLLKYTLIVTNDGYGTTTPLTPQLVTHGDVTAITATVTDTAEHIFKNWSVESGTASFANSSLASTTVTLTSGDATVQANFDKKYRIYWTNFSSPYGVMRSSLDYSEVEQIISGSGSPSTDIALDIANKKAYYCDYGKIGKCDLDGNNPETIYTTGGLNYALALDLISPTKKLYFANISIGIGRINLDGTDFEVFAPGGTFRGVAVDGASGYVYISGDQIYRGDITTKAITSLAYPDYYAYGIDLDLFNNQMYWVDYYTATVTRANLDGTNAVTIAGVPPKSRGISLDVDNNKMYIATEQGGEISEYDLTGNFIGSVSFGMSFSGIAIDTDP